MYFYADYIIWGFLGQKFRISIKLQNLFVPNMTYLRQKYSDIIQFWYFKTEILESKKLKVN